MFDVQFFKTVVSEDYTIVFAFDTQLPHPPTTGMAYRDADGDEHEILDVVYDRASQFYECDTGCESYGDDQSLFDILSDHIGWYVSSIEESC